MSQRSNSNRPGGVARAALLAVFALIAFALTAGTADAAPPANDDFANAINLAATLPANEGGSLAEATKQAGESDHTGFGLGGGHTVWYHWKPTADVTVAVGTCGSPSYAAAAVYSHGPVGATGSRLGTDSGCLNGTSSIVHATANQDYYIAVEDVQLGQDPGAYTLKLEVAGSLAGRVLNESAQPVADHCVDVIDPATNTVALTVHTGSDGRWLAELPPSSYRVRFSGCTSGGPYAFEFWQNAADEDAAATIALAPGQAKTGVDAVLEPASAILGKVTRPDGGNVANACVTAFDPDHPDREVASTSTDLSGNYRISNLSAASYKLLYEPGCTGGSDLKNEYYNDKGTFATADLVTVAVGQSKNNVDATLGDGGSISGTVRNAATAGIEDICVTATPSGAGTEGSTQTAANGSYTVSGLDPGSYTVKFSDCNTGTYASVNYPSAVSVAREQDVIGINITMAQNGTIKGTITGPAGASEPLQNICAIAIDAGGSEYASANTDVNGAYEIMGLAPGTYRLHFVDCADGSYVDEFYDNKDSLALATGITVAAGQTVTGKNASLSSAGAITGTITGPGSAPLQGICATALTLDGQAVGFGSSEADGHYLINHLVPGTYRVSFADCATGTLATEFYNDSATFSGGSNVTVNEGFQTEDINAQLAAGGSISGSVTEEGSAPAPDVCVSAFSSADAVYPIATTSTDSGGNYTLSGMRPGSFKVYFDGSCSLSQLAEEFYADAATFAAATPVSVTASSTHTGISASLNATQSPTVTIDSGPSGATADATPTFSFTRTGGGGVECSVDHGTAAFGPCSNALAHTPAANLADGSWTFRVRVSNAAGNQTQTRSFSVDTVAPALNITGGPSAPTNVQRPTFSFTTEAGASVQCSLDTGTASYGPCSAALAHQPAANLAEGNYTFRIRATDGVSNSSVSTRSFSVDTTAPTVGVTGGPNGPTNNPRPTFSFNSEAGSAVQCSVSTGAVSYGACSAAAAHQPASNLADASYTFTVKATDSAGNTNTATRTFSVDTVAPDTTITTGPTEGSTITTAGTSIGFNSTEGGSSFQCKLDGGTFQNCTSPKSLTSLSNGSHTFSVVATDAAGNADGSAATRTFTVDTADHTPPETTITSGPAQGSTVVTATTSFGFNADEGGSTFECKLDSGTFQSCSSPKALTGLDNGSHTFSVQATDPNGNTDPTPASRTFTVAIDSTPPETTIDSGPSGTIGVNSAAFTFHSNEANGTFQCQVDGGAFVGCTSPMNLSGLANGAHSFAVRAIDAAGNVDASPASSSFTVSVVTTPPPDNGACTTAQGQLKSAQTAMTKAKAKLKKAKSAGAKKKAKAAVKKAKQKVSAANQAVSAAC